MMTSIDAQVLRRRSSMLDGSLIYEISTAEIGLESDVKPIIENLPGIQAVFFDVFGHTYF
jgi:hypothetical protein